MIKGTRVQMYTPICVIHVFKNVSCNFMCLTGLDVHLLLMKILKLGNSNLLIVLCRPPIPNVIKIWPVVSEMKHGQTTPPHYALILGILCKECIKGLVLLFTLYVWEEWSLILMEKPRLRVSGKEVLRRIQ